MRRFISAAFISGGLLVVVLFVIGCESSGLSPREVRGRDYAGYVYSMYEPTAATPDKNAAIGMTATNDAAPRRPLATPARIAVAQLGEVAPPDKLMDKLRTDSAAFASVEPVSGVMDGPQASSPQEARDYSTRQAAQNHAERMRRYAADVGADYLFLYGGTLDRSTTSTPWVAANITIVGAFVIPSQQLDADVRAAGSLLDVRSGRAVLSVSADGHATKSAPSVGLENSEIRMLHKVRDEVIDELGTQLCRRVKEKAAAAAAPAAGG